MSRDLANGNARRKRDIGSLSREPVHFKLSAFGQDFHMEVTLNHELFSPNFEIEIRGNASSEFHYEIDHCHYIGQLLSAEGKRNKVAVSNCDGLVRGRGFTTSLPGLSSSRPSLRREEARDSGNEVGGFLAYFAHQAKTQAKQAPTRVINR